MLMLYTREASPRNMAQAAINTLERHEKKTCENTGSRILKIKKS